LRITIDVSLTHEKITAQLPDGTVVFDDVAVVALRPDAKGRQLIAGIGSDRPDRESTTVVPLVTQIQFQADLSAWVIWFVVMKVWNDIRPGWKAPLMLIDRVEAWVTIEGYERLTQDERRKFTKSLPYDRNITWWVGGEKVKY
jgi:hypothetical protein